MMKKAVMMLVLLLSLTFSIAQETDDIYGGWIVVDDIYDGEAIDGDVR